MRLGREVEEQGLCLAWGHLVVRTGLSNLGGPVSHAAAQTLALGRPIAAGSDAS